MHSLRAVLLLVSLLATAVFSSPTPQKRSFTHRVRRSVSTYGPDAGARAMAKAYRKYGFQLLGRAANTTSTSTGSQTGQVAAAPQPDDSEYLEAVNIGGQMVTMDFDTGSSDLYCHPNSCGV